MKSHFSKTTLHPVILDLIRNLLFFSAITFLLPPQASAAACAFPRGGNYTVSTSCNITADTIDGVDEASNTEASTANSAVLTVDPGVTLTIPSGVGGTSILAVGSISLNGGTLVIGSVDAQTEVGKPIYIEDADSDGYPDTTDTFFTATASGRRRRSLMRELVADCDTGTFSDTNSCGPTIYTRDIALTYSGSTLTDHDVIFELDTSTLITNSKMTSDCGDLRLYDSDDTTPINYWIEGGCNTTTTQIWTTVPSIPDGGKTIYAKYDGETTTDGFEAWSGNFTLLADVSCPAGWTRNIDLDGFIPKGAATYGTTSAGTSSHSHANASCTGGNATGTTSLTGGGVWIQGSHNHGTISTVIDSTSSVVPPYIETVFCETANLENKTGLISMYLGTTPASWTSVSESAGAYENRFPYGAATYGATGGSSTHTHTASGATAGSSSAGNVLRNPSPEEATGALSPHSHIAGTTTIGNGTHLPEYITVNYIKSTTESMLPEGSISIVDALPPLGWTQYSALDDKFPYGASTGGGTGGATSHTHSATITTGRAHDYDWFRSTGGAAAAGYGHGHSCATTTDAVSNLPPYIEVVFAQKNTPSATTSVGSEY